MKKTIRTLVAAALIAASGAACACAAVLQPNRINFETGKIAQKNETDLYIISVQPELKKGCVTAVVDVNFIFDNRLKLHDNGNDVVVLDSVAYNRDRFKARYGDIENFTLGRGFIVHNYFSDVMSNVQTNGDKGLVVDSIGDKSRLTVFGTVSHLAGGRAERSLGRFNVGTTVVFDRDPDLEILGLDAKFKLLPDKITTYAESAKITHAGSGYALGAAVTPFHGTDLTLTGEYRKFDSDFVPGIVDEHYEATDPMPAIRANPGSSRDGIYAAADYASGEHTSYKAFYEHYKDIKPRAGLGAIFQPTKRLGFNLYYARQNFVPSGRVVSSDSVILGRLSIGILSRLDLVVDYYHAYDNDQKPLKSIGVKVKVHKKRW